MSDPIWVRSIKYHSYHNVLQEPDTFYQVDNDQDLETVTSQRVAVREAPPAKAQREAPVPTPAPPAQVVRPAPMPASGALHPPPVQRYADTPRPARAQPMTSSDFPTKPKAGK